MVLVWRWMALDVRAAAGQVQMAPRVQGDEVLGRTLLSDELLI